MVVFDDAVDRDAWPSLFEDGLGVGGTLNKLSCPVSCPSCGEGEPADPAEEVDMGRLIQIPPLLSSTVLSSYPFVSSLLFGVVSLIIS